MKRFISIGLAVGGYAVLMLAFWFAARLFSIEDQIGGHMPRSFAAFGLMLAPYWFFGFGIAGHMRSILRRPAARVLSAGVLVVPYLVFSMPRSEFNWSYGLALFAIPVAIAALFEFTLPANDLSGIKESLGRTRLLSA